MHDVEIIVTGLFVAMAALAAVARALKIPYPIALDLEEDRLEV